MWLTHNHRHYINADISNGNMYRKLIRFRLKKCNEPLTVEKSYKGFYFELQLFSLKFYIIVGNLYQPSPLPRTVIGWVTWEKKPPWTVKKHLITFETNSIEER